MYKKLIYSSLGLIALIIVIFCFFSPQKDIKKFSENCPFCNSSILEYQKFYETDLVLALYNYKPILAGHCLILPKRHVERFEELSEEEVLQINQVIKKVNLAAREVFKAHSYLILEKNGIEAGQTVPHVHFHYISRKKGDSSVIKFLAKMYLNILAKPIKAIEMKKNVENMKLQMQSQRNN
jgi:histidine triad (HIT) family protein